LKFSIGFYTKNYKADFILSYISPIKSLFYIELRSYLISFSGKERKKNSEGEGKVVPVLN